MRRCTSAVIAIGAAALFIGIAPATSATERAAAETAAKFASANLSPRGFSYWEFEGEPRERMLPLLSRRLLASLDNVHSCVHDWAAHQPPNTTDKPPGVDCCVFSASADWSPTSFAIQQSKQLPDGRWRVTLEYRYDSEREHARWDVAVYVVSEADRFVVDDFEGSLDDSNSERWLTSAEDPNCKDGRWISPY